MNRGLKLLSIKVSPDTLAALKIMAEQTGSSVSTVTRELIEGALLNAGALGAAAKSLGSAGFEQGIRDGRRAFLLAMKAASDPLWEELK